MAATADAFRLFDVRTHEASARFPAQLIALCRRHTIFKSLLCRSSSKYPESFSTSDITPTAIGFEMKTPATRAKLTSLHVETAMLTQGDETQYVSNHLDLHMIVTTGKVFP